jgi:hypothetical protein
MMPDEWVWKCRGMLLVSLTLYATALRGALYWRGVSPEVYVFLGSACVMACNALWVAWMLYRDTQDGLRYGNLHDDVTP